MSIKIITDSASDIPQGFDMDLTILPLTVSFGEEQFQDNINLSHQEFYEKLIESDVLPTTSQIPPYDFEQAYHSVTDNGDTAIVSTLSAPAVVMISAQSFAEMGSLALAFLS